MSEIIEVELPDGEVILAEVTGTGGDVGALDRFKLDEARAAVGRIGRWARRAVLDGLPEPPERFGVEFGIKLAVKSGKLAGVLAEASGEATLTVRMEWEAPR